MSDYIPETPVVTLRWCPACDPDRDPVAEVLATQYCPHHVPASTGAADGQVAVSDAYIYGGQDAGGESNREWRRLLHRGRK